MADQEDYDNLPLQERLVHRIWKVRVQAFTELESKFGEAEDEKNPIFSQYATFLKKGITDVNAVVQEKALDALIVLVDRDALKVQSNWIKSVVEKCVNARRPSIRTKAEAALLLLIEIENIEATVAELLAGSKSKVPKLCAACLGILETAIRSFGVKAIPLKDVMKKLPSYFEESDSSVRDHAMKLAVEIGRWLGKDIILSRLKLRSAQMKDLEDALAALPSSPATPERYLRSQQEQQFVQASNGSETGGRLGGQEVDESQTVDPYDLLEAVNVLDSIGNSWHEAISAKKWSVRRDALDQLLALTEHPRLEKGDYTEVVRTLQRIISKDVNVICVSKAAKAAGQLGRGLRQDLSGSQKLASSMLLKFKEKKALVADALFESLCQMFEAGCFYLSDIADDLSSAVTNKVPQVRIGSMKTFLNCLERCTTKKQRLDVAKAVKSFGKMLLLGLNDSDGEVRDIAAKAFGALVGVVGERPLSPFLSKLEGVRLNKVKEHFPKTPPPPVPVLGAPSQTKSRAQSKKASTKETPSHAVAAPGNRSSTRRKATSRTVKSSNKASSAATTRAPTSAANQKSNAEVVENVPSVDMEKAREHANEVIPTSIQAQLKDANWKNRIAGIEQLQRLIAEKPSVFSLESVLLGQISQHPGYSDSIVHVLNQALLFTQWAFTHLPASKSVAGEVISLISEKIGDPKVNQSVVNCLNAMSEVLSPGFVICHLCKHTGNHRNPKVIKESVDWIWNTVEDYGMDGVNGKALVLYLKSSLHSSNAQVRSSAIRALVVLRKWMGAEVRLQLSDLKSSLTTVIDREFDKVANVKPAARKREQRGKPTESCYNKKMFEELLHKMEHSDWSVRRSAIAQLDEVVTCSKSQLSPLLDQLMPALKLRLHDSNKNLTGLTLTLLGKIAEIHGTSVAKYSKLVVPLLLASLGETKKPVVLSATKCLNQWVNAIGIEQFITFLPVALQNEASRRELLPWIEQHLPSHSTTADLRTIIVPTLASLEDRNATVRKHAEGVLLILMKAVGYEMIKHYCRDFRKSSMLLIGPILERTRSSAEEKSQKTQKSSSKDVSKVKESSPLKGTKALLAKDSQVASGQASTPLLVNTREKSLREERFLDRPWKLVGDDGSNQIESARTLMENYLCCSVSRSLFTCLCSSEEKHQTDGISTLIQLVESQHERLDEALVDSIDILFQWAAITLVSDKPLKVKQDCVNFLQRFLRVLATHDYQLSDYEISLLMQGLMIAFGASAHSPPDLQEQLALLRGILRCVYKVYPVSKVMPFYLPPLACSFAAPSRFCSEILSEIAYLFSRHGIGICTPSQALPVIFSQLCRQEAEVRSATFEAIKTIHALLLDGIWTFLPNISTDERVIVEEFLRSSGGTRTPQQVKLGPLEEATHDLEREVDQAIPPVRCPQFPTLLSTSTTTFSTPTPTLSSRHISIVEQFNRDESSRLFNSWFAGLSPSAPENKVIDTLKQVCIQWEKTGNGTGPSCANSVFVWKGDALLECLTQQLLTAFYQSPKSLADVSPRLSSRYCKYVANTVMMLMSSCTVCKSLSSSTLFNLIQTVLSILSSKKLADGTVADGAYLLKVLNQLMLNILEYSPRTTTLVVLLQLLTAELSHYNSMSPKTELIANSFTDLLMKCLLKLTKALKCTIHDVNRSVVLQHIHLFFEAHTKYIRSKNTEKRSSDMPMKTVKTLLHEIVKLSGADVVKYLNLVPSSPVQDASSERMKQPVIFTYVQLMMKALGIRKLPDQATPITSFTSAAGSPETTVQMQANQENLVPESFSTPAKSKSAASCLELAIELGTPKCGKRGSEMSTSVLSLKQRLQSVAARTNSVTALTDHYHSAGVVAAGDPEKRICKEVADSSTDISISALRSRLERLKKSLHQT